MTFQTAARRSETSNATRLFPQAPPTRLPRRARLALLLAALFLFAPSAVLLTPASTANAQTRLRGEQYPETRQRYLRETDMARYTTTQLQYALNELLAREGYLFETASLERSFSRYSWYRPRTDLNITQIVQRMTPTELNNYRLILATIRARRAVGGGGSGGDGSTSGFRFPQTRTRYMTAREIESLSDANLRYALNEVYARHGYRFRTPETYRLFRQRTWYRPITGQSKERTERKFNRYEIGNVRALNDELDFRNGVQRD